MKKAIIILFLLLAGYGFGQVAPSTGSYWKVSKLTTPIGKALLDSTQVYVKANFTWYQLKRNVPATMTMQKAIDSAYVSVVGSGTYAPALHSQAISTVTGLLDSLGNHYTKTQAGNLFAPIAHTQAISTVTGLQDSLLNHYTKAQSLTYLENVYAQGVQWNQTTDVYTRLGSISGETKNVSPGNSKLPIQSLMKGCLLSDAGVVNYYLNATDWTLKEDGTASTLTGADGQVMIEIPRFYVKYINTGSEISWLISLYQLPGFTLHNAFIKDGVEVQKRYIGAYEGVLYDVSGAAYTDGGSAQTKDWTASTGDKLSSVSGFIPVSNGTRAQFRTIAKNRGTGWRQLDYDIVNAVQILQLVEYASFYLQNIAEVGPGITNVTDWAATSYWPFNKTGTGNTIGNGSGDNAGSTSRAIDSLAYSKYRGLSNWYGHIWKFVDGFNINGNVPYVTNNSTLWADNTSAGYSYLGVTLPASDGWQNTFVNSARAMLPATVGAASTTKVTDYYYQNTGWRVARFGGSADNGANAGGWCWRLNADSGYAHAAVGSRLAF